MRHLASLLSCSALLLAGCGVGTITPTTVAPHTTFSGQVRGGEAPIIYSKISFYETATTGVPANTIFLDGVYAPNTPLTALGSTFTDINGNFSFATPLQCSNVNNFVYAVAQGGNTGSYPGTLNNAMLEMAAIGSCNGFGASTFVVMNEVTTIAAGYALSGFLSISADRYTTSATNYTATIGGYANNVITFQANNAFVSGQPVTISNCSIPITGPVTGPAGSYFILSATPTTFSIAHAASSFYQCTAAVTSVTSVPIVSVTSSATNFAPNGTGTNATAAGLNHAFANAANLASTITGRANATIPGQANTVVPSALINSIANTLQACVNSTGLPPNLPAYSFDTTNSVCGRLFTNTLDSAYSSGVPPNNTLQSVLNMAHFPTQNVATIIGLASATPSFTPTLTNTPSDLSMAIQYLAGYGGSGNNGLTTPKRLAIDANDNIYLLNGTGNFGNSGANVIALTSYGQSLWTMPIEPYSPGGISTDGFGNLFVSINPAGVSGPGFIQEFATSSGAFEQNVAARSDSQNDQEVQQYTDLANDAAGNVFSAILGGSDHVEIFLRSGTGKGVFDNEPTVKEGTGYLIHSLQVAADGTVYYAPYDPNGPGLSGSSYLTGLPYTGTGSNFYTAVEVTDYDSGNQNNATGVTAITTDRNGLIWTAGGPLVTYTRMFSGGALTGFTPGSAGIALPTGNLYALNVDGNNAIWGAGGYGSGSAIARYNQAANSPTAIGLTPCIVNTQAACTNLMQEPATIQIDSTGSVWVVDTASVFQILGTASPTWPLLAKQTPGIIP